jgi:ElaB/YqjD/DUF883 family membrane-anchored ribosome-binding protein
MSDFTATPKTAAGEDAEAQLRRLQGEVESLMRDKVTPALVGAVDRVAAAAEYAAERIRTNSDMVADNVRERPLMALLIVGVIGYILGRAAR